MNYIFEWDELKNRLNMDKHGLSFEEARKAFYDRNRVIKVDTKHSDRGELRQYCIGKINKKIITVRFTYRGNVIRIFGAAQWRKGRKLYEQEPKNNLQRHP
jgi:uncharacterized protein